MNQVARTPWSLGWVLLLAGACSPDRPDVGPLPAFCGNGQLDPGELCDDPDLYNSDHTPDACREDCTLPRCGDGVKDQAEECDGPLPWWMEGQPLGLGPRALPTCNTDCTVDYSRNPTCGDGQASGTDPNTRWFETCDGTDLRSLDCEVLGRGEGALACTDCCALDVAGCDDATPLCGNGVKEHPERCDDGDEADGDGCSSRCIPEHPDWVLVSPERSLSWVGSQPTALAENPRLGHLALLVGSWSWESDGVTWLYDGRGWALVASQRDPPGRGGVERALTYDGSGVLLFGGKAGLDEFHPLQTFQILGDLWRLEGAQWTELTPAALPPPRSGHVMAYDEARERVVLFGGVDEVAAFADTWEWDGQSWQETTPGRSPPPGEGYSMAYDPSREALLLFGGPLRELWEYDGSSWMGPHPQPPSRAGNAPAEGSMAYNPRRGRMVLYADTLVRHFTWELYDDEWIPLFLYSDPEWRQGFSLIWYSQADQLLLFGNRPTRSDEGKDLHRMVWR